jgi:hypothetical protein
VTQRALGSWWGDVPVGRRIVLVAVKDLDRRAIAAVSYARRLPAQQHLALHVILDADHSGSLGLKWMKSRLHSMPLHLVDDIGGVPATVRAAVELTLAQGADEAVVVIGQMSNPNSVRRYVHAHAAEQIHDALVDIERARIALVAVSPTA